MARGLTDYLNDWNIPTSGERKSASGGDNAGDPANGDGGGVPARWKMPPTPEWGYGKDGNSGGFGHSDDCEYTGTKGATWGMSKDDVARGYENLKSDGEGGVLETRQPYGSFEQSIPTSNPHDRGSGSDSYAREHSDTTGRGFDGRGQPESTSNPGGESLGSSKLPY